MLKEMANEEGVGIVALTESHLNNDYHDGEIAINNFTNFRVDRCQGTRKGGVIIYLRSCLTPNANLLLSESHGNIEYAVLDNPAACITLVCVYRPPTAELSVFIDVLSKINQCLVLLSSRSSLAFCGDLNFPNIRWPSLVIQGGTRALCQQAQALLDFFGEHFLLQIIEEPIRGTNILDLFAVNDDKLILRYQVMSKSKISDHNVVLITTTQYLTPESHTTSILEPLFTLNFWSKSIDWSVIGAKFSSINWETQLTI